MIRYGQEHEKLELTNGNWQPNPVAEISVETTIDTYILKIFL